MIKPRARIAAILGLALGVAACGGGGGVSARTATEAYGPITIWYSNNAAEVAWGEQVVASWNKSHPDQQVSGEQIPSGQSSEEVIGAAITAGTEPCLIYNTSPASVPDFEKQGGLVPLLAPYVTASVAIIGVWLFMFSPTGIVNTVLGPLAPVPSWLVNQNWAMPSIAIYVTWKGLGFYILLYLAALQGVPKELYEAAAMDGASWWHRFRSVPSPACGR